MPGCIASVNRVRTRAGRDRRWAHRVQSDPVAVERASSLDRDGSWELRDWLQKALERLDPAVREAVVLKLGEGLAYSEISERTGVSISALKMRVLRGREALRHVLEEVRGERQGGRRDRSARPRILGGDARGSTRHAERLHATLAAIDPPRRTPGAFSWWLRPMTVRIRPAWALAIAAVLAAVVIVAVRAPLRSATERPEQSAVGSSERPVNSSSSPRALSRSPWWATSMPGIWPRHRCAGTSDPGVWRMRVTLAPGLHLYGFVVDGRDWVTDPKAPLVPADLYGSRNSVVVGGEL